MLRVLCVDAALDGVTADRHVILGDPQRLAGSDAQLQFDEVETGDRFAEQRELPEVREGDVLAIENAGAYCYSMGGVYNMRPMPTEVIVENGGTAVRTRVGHSFIKQTMADTGAVFGGEHSGHFYFRDFWRADSGMLAAMHALAALGETPEGATFSSMLAPYDRYCVSGEINTTVADAAAATEAIRQEFASRAVDVEDFDGMTVTGDDWWFNVRPSNTEPLLRLNVEAADESAMAALRDEVLTVMREGA